MISPIDRLSPISSLQLSEALEQTQEQSAGKGMFASIFQNAIDNVKEIGRAHV